MRCDKLSSSIVMVIGCRLSASTWRICVPDLCSTSKSNSDSIIAHLAILGEISFLLMVHLNAEQSVTTLNFFPAK